MCGIIGCFNNEKAIELVIKGLELLKNRGEDAQGISDCEKIIINKKEELEKNNGKISLSTKQKILSKLKGENCIGHTLHSIVGEVAQPIKKKGIITFNGEIYNWKELAKKEKIKAKNDADLLLQMLDNIYESDSTKEKELKQKELSSKELEKKLFLTLNKLDGVYAFCHINENKVIIARDLVGVKPLWYSHQQGLSFASEKKQLLKMGFRDCNELNPRTALCYDIKKNKLERKQREFFKIKKNIRLENKNYEEQVAKTLTKAIIKRIPDKKIKLGILFSGGLDSSLIAKVCKDKNYDATCYTAVIDNPDGELAHDEIAAKKVAKRYGLKHKIIRTRKEEIPKIAKEVVTLIEEPNAIKTSVAMPFLQAIKQAKKDGCKVMFSGLGAEELFAGYQRHKNSNDVNNECYAGLLWMYERDLYRDDVISINNRIELRLPFLDKKLIEESLKIPAEKKLKKGIEKYVLRKAATKLGLEKEDAYRPKKAAQYGSKFDLALKKTAKKQGMKRSEYLRTLLQNTNRKLGILCSGGKDGWYAAHVMKKLNYELTCLLTIKSENQDSYMFHTPAINLVRTQAKISEISLIEQETKGIKEEELKDLKKLIKKAKKEHKIEGIVTGALYSQYQRERVEKICEELEIKTYAPLWHLEQESELRELTKEDFKITMSSIAGDGLNTNWLGKTITKKEIEKLVELNKKIGFHVAGEGGEYESLVLDCPLFNKTIILKKTRIEKENEYTARLIIDEVELKPKN